MLLGILMYFDASRSWFRSKCNQRIREKGKRMKTYLVTLLAVSAAFAPGRLLNNVLRLLLGTCLVGTVHGQLFVANYGSGTIGEYTTSGATINSSLVSGLSSPEGLAYDGHGHLFVVNTGNSGFVGEYSTAGATVNSRLIQGLYYPTGIASDGNGHLAVACYANPHWGITFYTDSGVGLGSISDYGYPSNVAYDGNGHVFVANWNSGSIGEYTTNGTVLNDSLIGGLQFPFGIALDGNGNLFVVNCGNYQQGFIGEYTTSGTTVDANLISGLNAPQGIALYGNDLFVADTGNNRIGEYTTTGMVVDASLISGLNSPAGVVVVPEPSPAILVLLGLALTVYQRFKVICQDKIVG